MHQNISEFKKIEYSNFNKTQLQLVKLLICTTENCKIQNISEISREVCIYGIDILLS
jgi:hypothetical protein